MTPGTAAPVSGAVEGIVDEAVLRRLCEHVGGSLGTVHVKGGKHRLLHRLGGYNKAARFGPWAVLVDLDQDRECVVDFVRHWLPYPAEHMRFRVCVRQVETWLLADRERLSAFLAVPRATVPRDPDRCGHAKHEMVNLAGRSTRRAVREEMVPRPRSGRPTGPAYSARLIEFAREHWRPDVAAERSESLQRCVTRLAELTAPS